MVSIKEFDDLYFWGSNFPSYSLTGWDINQEFVHWPAASGCKDATFSSACILHNSLWKSLRSFHAGRTRRHTIAMSRAGAHLECIVLVCFLFSLLTVYVEIKEPWHYAKSGWQGSSVLSMRSAGPSLGAVPWSSHYHCVYSFQGTSHPALCLPLSLSDFLKICV